MSKNFPEHARLVFQDAWMCWWCGENTADCLHHIVGKDSYSKDDCEGSIFNAAPLCNNKCHLPNHGLLRSEEKASMLLIQTKKYLLSKGIKPNKKDKQLFRKYKHLYKQKHSNKN